MKIPKLLQKNVKISFCFHQLSFTGTETISAFTFFLRGWMRVWPWDSDGPFARSLCVSTWAAAFSLPGLAPPALAACPLLAVASRFEHPLQNTSDLQLSEISVASEDGKHIVGVAGHHAESGPQQTTFILAGKSGLCNTSWLLNCNFPAFLPTHCAWDYTCLNVHVLHCCVPAWIHSLKNNYFMWRV